LLMFSILTIHSIKANRERHFSGGQRYFWWGALRLDSDPWNRHPRSLVPEPCEDGEPNCVAWDPEYIWVEPGILERALIVSAVPAFALGALVCAGLARLGISKVLTFMISMPILIFVWFYFLGWLIDRWRYKRRSRLLPT
jgi:hypothetical protein